MEKESINIYKTEVNKNFNSQAVFYSKLMSKKDNSKAEISRKIDDLLKSPEFVYKIKAEIELDGIKMVRDIIGRNKQYLITLNNENILISRIKNIEVVE